MIYAQNNNTYDMLTSAEKTPGIDEDRRMRVAEAKIDRFIMLLVLFYYIVVVGSRLTTLFE